MPKITFSTEEVDEMQTVVTTMQNALRTLVTQPTMEDTYEQLLSIINQHSLLEKILQSHYDFITTIINQERMKGVAEQCPDHEIQDSSENGLSVPDVVQ